jgi:hypothetical protein
MRRNEGEIHHLTQREMAPVDNSRGFRLQFQFVIYLNRKERPSRVRSAYGQGVKRHHEFTIRRIRAARAKPGGAQVTLSWIESQVWTYLCQLSKLARGAFPKIETIARKFGYARRRIEMCIAKFKAAGWLTVKRRGPTSSQYFVKEFTESPEQLTFDFCASFCASTPILSEVESERVERARQDFTPDVSHLKTAHSRFAATNFWKKAKEEIRKLATMTDDEVWEAVTTHHGRLC